MTTFTRTWNAAYEASPADSQSASQGATRIRELKNDISERLEVDHSWAGDANDGAHKWCTMIEQASDPTNVANRGFVYAKDVGGITELYYIDSAGTVTQITSNGTIQGTPAGAIQGFMRTTAPSGWLVCDGSAVSRTTYATLFGIIDEWFGNGDGVTTFNLPDLRGYFLRGWDNTAGNDPDAASRTDRGDGTGGDVIGSQQADEVKDHDHGGSTSTDGAHTHAGGFSASGNDYLEGTPGGSTANTGSSGSHSHTISGNGGSESRPININVLYCIKF